MDRRKRPRELQTKRVKFSGCLRQVHELRGAPESIVSKNYTYLYHVLPISHISMPPSKYIKVIVSNGKSADLGPPRERSGKTKKYLTKITCFLLSS